MPFGLTEVLQGCRLPPKDQAARLAELRTDLLARAEPVLAAPGSLRFRFPDKPENVADLTEFIRFERGCCTSVRFRLDWEPEGGPIFLEMKAPPVLISALFTSI